MDDFTSKVGVPNDYGLIQGEANAIAPKKRPLSSMTPTIVLKDGKPFFAIGSPGGPTHHQHRAAGRSSTSSTSAWTSRPAIDAPRFHHQWLPDDIFWEDVRHATPTRARSSKQMGHKFRPIPGASRSPWRDRRRARRDDRSRDRHAHGRHATRGWAARRWGGDAIPSAPMKIEKKDPWPPGRRASANASSPRSSSSSRSRRFRRSLRARTTSGVAPMQRRS